MKSAANCVYVIHDSTANAVYLPFCNFQTVAITERKQRCGLEGELATTKICFTYPDASWVCRQARSDRDCDR